MLGNRGAMRDQRYKIIVGRCCPEGYPGLCQRSGPQSPNSSTHLNTTDVDCINGPCVFDLVEDPGESININASSPDVTARLLQRFRQLSSELASGSDIHDFFPVVPSSTRRSSWGSVDVAQEVPTGYGGCTKMASTGFWAPWMGGGCQDPSGFCGLDGRSCATPSNGGLGSVATVPYYEGYENLTACMARCEADTLPIGTGKQSANACSCFDWAATTKPSCRLHNTTWRFVSYAVVRSRNCTAFTRSSDPVATSVSPLVV